MNVKLCTVLFIIYHSSFVFIISVSSELTQNQLIYIDMILLLLILLKNRSNLN